jgi:hypothetical protein
MWRNLIHSWWECKLVQPLSRPIWRFFKRLSIELSYDSKILLLALDSKKMKSVSQRDICTPIFCEALFAIAKIWNQLVSVNKWMDKENVVSIRNGILFCLRMKSCYLWNLGSYCANWKKPGTERQIPHDLRCVWNLKQLNF